MKRLFSIITAIFLLPAMFLISGCNWFKKSSKNPQTPKEFVYELSADGKSIYFGEYPQTIKADNVTVSQFSDRDGYYLGSDGEKYQKLVIDYSTFAYNEEETNLYNFNKLSNGHKFVDGETLYFKIEKIKWDIVTNDDGDLFVICDTIIDHSLYQQYSKYDREASIHYITDKDGNWIYNEDGQTKIPAHYYSYSTIRQFLSNSFYNMAFDSKQKSMIPLTSLSSKHRDSYYGDDFNDKSNNYVFEFDFNDFDKSYKNYKYKQTTDYAKARGCFTATQEFFDIVGLTYMGTPVDWEFYKKYLNTGSYWTRTMYHYYMPVICRFGEDDYEERYNVRLNSTGVVPAMYVNLNQNKD